MTLPHFVAYILLISGSKAADLSADEYFKPVLVPGMDLEDTVDPPKLIPSMDVFDIVAVDAFEWDDMSTA